MLYMYNFSKWQRTGYNPANINQFQSQTVKKNPDGYPLNFVFVLFLNPIIISI